jgi:hypothetical protein
MSDGLAPLAGMLDLRSDGVYCIPCQRLLRSVGSHLRKHGIHGKHNRSTLQRMFGLPMGARLASDATRDKNQGAALENGSVYGLSKRKPNVWEATRAASIARQQGQRSAAQQAASYALGAGVGRATLPAARARRRELAFRRNNAVITCEHCGFTVMVERRAPSDEWSRFCSTLCRRRHTRRVVCQIAHPQPAAVQPTAGQRRRLAWQMARERSRSRRG